MDWRDRAACRDQDPDLFFPVGRDDAEHGPYEPARAVCATCPVREECLAYALATRQRDGMWGGLTTTERRDLERSIARERRQAAGGAAS